tara:strand:+ start:7660 stop:8226 length:567 start_codon:yes stop_codon:yes gene_type:complete
MDEPVLKKVVRIRKVKGDEIFLGMSIKMWLDIFLKYFELVDLIMLSRTSIVFAGYKPFKDLIKLKTKAAFNKISKRGWNKLGRVNNVIKTFTVDFAQLHVGKYIIIQKTQYGLKNICLVGAFSTKQRMLKMCKSSMEKTDLRERQYNISLSPDDNKIIMLKGGSSVLSIITVGITMEEFTEVFHCADP